MYGIFFLGMVVEVVMLECTKVTEMDYTIALV